MSEAELNEIDPASSLDGRFTQGRYRGQRVHRVPQGYLLSIANDKHPLGAIARAELARRGAIDRATIELSAHAINRASVRLSSEFGKRSQRTQGLYSWLLDVAVEAFQYGAVTSSGRREDGDQHRKVDHDGMRFIFACRDGLMPVLVTVKKLKGAR